MKNRPILLVMLTLLMPLATWGQKTLPYDYGFENNDLVSEGWTKYSSSSNTNIATGAKRTGDYGFRFYKSPDPQYLISPLMPSATNGLSVAFYYQNTNSNYPKSFRVGYSTTGTWVSDFTFGDEITTTDTQWTLFSQTFSANTKYIAIKYVYNDSYSNLYLDDFSFEAYSDYPQPKNLVVTTYTSSTATLDWTPRTGQDHWDIYYTTSPTVPDASTAPSVVNTETRPYTITGLQFGATYHAYVRGNYNNGEHYSDWSNACDFEVGCFTPTIGQAQASCNMAYFTWTPGGIETSWQAVFSDQQGFDPDAATPETVTTQYYYQEDLATGVTYYGRVRAVCGEGDYSDWSEEVSMTTECFAPTNLHESSVTTTTATLAWTKGSSETEWQISYSTMENFSPENGTIVTANTNQYTFNGLIVNTAYYAYVRAVCGESIYSDWSNVCAFMPRYELTVSDDETNYNMYVPFYGYFVSYLTKSQFIIPASDLTDLLYANINKLSFYAGVETANFGSATFDILISELDNGTVFENSEFFDWSEMTSVYLGSLSVSDNKMEITLNTPYQYMGGDLLIGFNQTTSGTGVSAYWYGAATTGYSAYGGMEMSSYSSYSRHKFIPKTTFSYTPGTAPTCMKPSNLSISQTSRSATLTWTAGDDETLWNVQYKEASASEWSNIIVVENTPTYTLNDLSPITNYQVRVQADCGGGDTSGWIVCSFTTSCGPTDVPYTHDFDNDATGSSAAFPQCWTKINDAEDPDYADYPNIMGSNAHSGSNCLFFMRLYDYTAINQIAVFPEMNADVRTLQLSFYARLGSGTNQPLSVGVMTDPEDASTFVKIEDVAIASNEYAEYTVSFASYAGSGHFIALKCERADVYNQIYVDDINVTTNNICFAPENPQISDVTAHTAVFTWTPGSETSSWQVQYKKSTETEWSESVSVSGTPSYSFSNLDATTTYQARVRTDCGNDNYSDWVDAENFTTDCGFVTLPYSHDFDDDATGHVAPTCWHFSDGTYPYIYESSSAHSGNHYLQIKKNTDYAATLVLPAIDTDENPISTLKLTFWAKASQSTYYYEYLYAGVMTDPDDMSTFQSVQGATTNLSTTTYKQFEFYFDNWTGEGNYIALRYGGSTTYYIDDIEISVAPTCRQPLELSSNYTDVHEANIRWKTRDLKQCNYQVSYSTTEGFNPENGTIVDAEFETDLVNAGTPYRYYDLTSLDANTTYYFYVRANCGEGDFSAWSDDYGQFTTMEACPVPYVNPNTVGSHSVTFRVMDYEYGTIELRYKKASDEWSAWSQVEYTGMEDMSHFFVLDNLEENTDYQVEIRANCGEDGYSTDVLPLSFTTATGCGSTPRTWMCTTHLGTKATVEWFPENDATRWQIRYRIEGLDYDAQNMVLTDEITSTPYRWTLTNLQTSTVYYWQVRSYCDENTQSDWSEEAWFTTRCSDGFITVDKAHPFFEDFEGADMPDCWDPVNHYDYSMSHLDDWSHITGTNYSWETYNASKCISSDRNHFHFNSNGAAVLAPALHIDENATSATLSFWSKCDFESSDARGTMHIFVSDNINADDGCDFDLGTLWESFGRKSFWRKYVISLDDYIGKTINIRFEYGVTHNYNNYDWLIDDVKVEVFDNVFGEGSDITEGSWDDPSMWRTGNSKAVGGLPTINDNVLINAKVMIPEGFVAQVNKIELNIDTVQVDRSGINKYGSLVIADGGQLKVNNPVGATMQKAIAGYGRGGSNWFLIAPPVVEALKPKSDSIGSIIEGTYDLYSFDGSQQGEEWRNYKQHEQTFKLKNGLGYLVANSVNTSASFTGTVLPSNQAKEVGLAFAETTFGAWNLVGNPYTCQAYLSGDRPFYRLEETAEGSRIVLAASNAIAPMEGIFVQASDGDDTVTFTTTAPTANANALNFSLRKVEQGRGSISTPIDRARIRFGEGDNLGKLTLMASPDRLYIPQNGTDYAVVFSQPVGELPLNFEASENGTYTIAIDIEDLNLSYLHLIDNLTGTDIDLLSAGDCGSESAMTTEGVSYTFTAKTTDYASRFRVVFAAAGAGGDACEPSFAFENNGNWIILNEGRATLQVIDLNGRILSSEQIEGSVQTSIHQPAGLYLIRLLNGNDVKVQKVVVR